MEIPALRGLIPFLAGSKRLIFGAGASDSHPRVISGNNQTIFMGHADLIYHDVSYLLNIKSSKSPIRGIWEQFSGKQFQTNNFLEFTCNMLNSCLSTNFDRTSVARRIFYFSSTYVALSMDSKNQYWTQVKNARTSSQKWSWSRPVVYFFKCIT